MQRVLEMSPHHLPLFFTASKSLPDRYNVIVLHRIYIAMLCREHGHMKARRRLVKATGINTKARHDTSL